MAMGAAGILEAEEEFLDDLGFLKEPVLDDSEAVRLVVDVVEVAAKLSSE